MEAVKAVEHWAKELHTPAWLVAAARARFGWATGKQLTRENYLKLIEATQRGVA